MDIVGLYELNADFDGDGKADRALWEPGGTWSIERSLLGPYSRNWGLGSLGDIPVPADYDGDGKADLAVWRRSTGQWFTILSSTGGTYGPAFGSAGLGDVPVPGDYDGDGKADRAIWRTSNGQWLVTLTTGGSKSVTLGSIATGDIPVPRDYDGDGKTDFAVWRPTDGTWYLQYADGTSGQTQWGTQGDTPVPGDYTGDGKADFVVRRPGNNQWYIKPSNGNPWYGPFWGDAAQGDIPMAGADYDGDKKADLAVWRPSTGAWSIRTTGGATLTSTAPAGSVAGKHHPIPSLWTVPAPPKLKGFADLHLHMMAEEAFGGGWLHGQHDGPNALTDCDGGGQDLIFFNGDHGRVQSNLFELMTTCPASLGITFAGGSLLYSLITVGGVAGSEAIGMTEGTKGDTGLHLHRKHYGSDWPRWDTIAHHQAWGENLRQAHASGLSVVVMSAVSYEWLCKIMPAQNRSRGCDEMVDVKIQLQMAQDFAAKNSSWLQIAYSPGDIRAIAGSGKLAMVLSVEASHIMGRDVNASNLIARLDELYNLGVRTLQLVHQQDNPLAGAATHHPIFQFAQYTENCHVDFDCGLTTDGMTLGFDVDSNCRNVKGLTPLGQTLIREMIQRKMLIDGSHLSERSLDGLFALTEAEQFYPVYLSHGHFREIMTPEVADREKTTPAGVIRRLRRSGGIFGLRTAHEETHRYTGTTVPNTCHGASSSFAQAYEFGRKGLKVDIALGSDLNGFIQQTRPRFGDLGACSAGSRGEAQCQERDQRDGGAPRLGSDFDEKGLAHVGLLPDLIKDVHNQGVDTSNLENSSENFTRMWERAYGPRSGPADAASDIDTGGVIADRPAKDRAEDYPEKCNKEYCPRSLDLGYSCEFNEECASNQCTAIICGTIDGRCVCDQDHDCPTGKWCDRNAPLFGGDNRCRDGKADHDTCSRDNMCASGSCGGIVNGLGWCFTPSSKDYDQGCRANGECKSNRCGDLTQLCKCKVESDCPSGQFCGTAFNDGKCLNKRSDHTACTHDFECASGNCGGFIGSSGWCYTPHSKQISQGCRADDECATNRCVDLKLICGCTQDGQCGGGEFCNKTTGDCVGKKGRYGVCNRGAQCKSGKCGITGCTKP